MYDDDRRLRHDAAPDERLTSLLEAASAPIEPGPVLGELEALAAFRASHTPVSASGRSSVSSLLTSARVTVGATLGALLLTGGVGAAAAAGSLPGAAQDTASEWLSKVGVTVPAAADRAEPHDGRSDDSGEDEGPAETTPDGHGEKVSELARDTEKSGVDKGAAISELASDGRSSERGASRGHADKGHERAGHEGRHGEDRGDDEERRSQGEDAGDDVGGTEELQDGDAAGSTTPTDADEDRETSATEKTDEARESYGSADSKSRP